MQKTVSREETPMATHRLTRWFLVFALALLALPTSVLGTGQTPVSGDTQLYIGHSARLIADIPAT
jgi:hypothetical protein